MVRGFVAVLVLILTPAAVLALCGDVAGDAAAVAQTRADIESACPCADASRHGAYVHCVVTNAEAAILAGRLPRQCKGAVIRCAARSTCGKHGFVTCCRTSAAGTTRCKVKRDATLCVAPAGGEACVGAFTSCCDACGPSGCATTSTTSSSTTTTSTAATPSTTSTTSSTTTIPPCPSQAQYSFTSLDYPDSSNTEALGISNAGEVVGGAAVNGTGIGYSFTGGTFTPITVPGFTQTEALGVNDTGDVVGEASNGCSCFVRAFVYSGGSIETFNAPEADNTSASDINNLGQITGRTSLMNGTPVSGFVKTGDSFSTVAFPTAEYTRAWGMNDAGVVVGDYIVSGVGHGYVFDGQTYASLDIFGAVAITVTGINGSGQVVGYYADGTTTHGFVRDSCGISVLDVPGAHQTSPFDINDAGVIVGYYGDGSTKSFGFVASPDGGGATTTTLATTTSTATTSTATSTTTTCATCISDVFIPTTAVETITVPFIAPEVHTVAGYSGLVEVNVAGMGQGAGGSRFNDAFYFLDPTDVHPPGSALVMSFAPTFCSGGCCHPPGDQEANQLLVFAEGVGDVTPPYTPLFDAGHTYRFVVDLGTFSGQLTLANNDCGLGDNTGQYDVTLNGVQRR